MCQPDAEELRTLERLARAFEQFRLFGSNMSISSAQAFCEIAKEPGKLSVSEIARRLGIDGTVLSRQLMDLSRRNRNGTEGLGLIDWTYDPSFAGKNYVPTEKGVLFIKSLTETFEKK